MTTITFKPDSTHQFVDWNDPARWAGGVVPNDPTVDVIIPTTTVIASGAPYNSFIGESGAIAIGSLAISDNYLLLNGALTVTHSVNISAGGEIDMRAGSSLSAASIDNNGIDIQGEGSVNVTGLFLNETLVVGNGLSLTAASLTNPGSLIAASGNLTVTVSHGGFTNLSGSTLTGGSYRAGFNGNQTANSLYLNVGAVIAVDAATISLDGGGAIYSFDDASHSYVPIQTSLHSIAASGTLLLASQTYTWSNLTVDGSLTLLNSTLQATQLTVDASGTVKGFGTFGGPILNNGMIVANALVLNGPISGSGIIEIAPATPVVVPFSTPIYFPTTLELAAAASSDVVFNDGHGILTLDDVAEYSGKITLAAAGDQIIVRGTSFDSVTGYSYSGDSHGGTLAIQTTGGEIDLQFLGNFATANFSLAAGPQHLSSDPASLLITNTGSASTVLVPIAEDSGARLITQSELLAGFVGASPVVTSLAITSGNGTLVNNSNGTWSYTAAHNDDTAVSFAYNLTYGGGPVTASATLDLTSVNDAPIAANSSAGSNEDTAISGSVSATDVDNTAAQLTYSLVGTNGGAVHGTVAFHADGSFIYTPVSNFNGNDSFSFKASDGSLDSNVATESLTIGAVNDAPVNTVPEALSTSADIDFAITGLSVADVDATSLTTTLHVDHGTLAIGTVGGAAVSGNGTATVTVTGSVAQVDAALGAAHNVLYHSAFNFSGLDHLTMTSNDGGSSGAGGALTDIEMVNIQVAAASIQEIATPPHLAFGGLGATSAGMTDFAFLTGDIGHTLDVNAPGFVPSSDFHLF